MSDKKVVYVTCIPADMLRPISPSIEINLWRSIALKIAELVLSQENEYGTLPHDWLKRELELSHLPDLRHCKKLFLYDLAKVTVLIEGLVSDCMKEVVYRAPMAIPRSVTCLLLKSSENPALEGSPPVRLLIIPQKHVDLICVEVCDSVGHLVEVDMPCLLHRASFPSSSDTSKSSKSTKN